MLGYFGGGTDAGEVIDEEGWLYTGDLAAMYAQELARILGREKDMSIRGGQNIHRARIQRCLEGHPDLREAAEAGGREALSGEAVWASVVASEAAIATVSDLADHCRVSLEPFEVPQEIRFLDPPPRTITGKVQKFILQEIANQQVNHDEPRAP